MVSGYTLFAWGHYALAPLAMASVMVAAKPISADPPAVALRADAVQTVGLR